MLNLLQCWKTNLNSAQAIFREFMETSWKPFLIIATSAFFYSRTPRTGRLAHRRENLKFLGAMPQRICRGWGMSVFCHVPSSDGSDCIQFGWLSTHFVLCCLDKDIWKCCSERYWYRPLYSTPLHVYFLWNELIVTELHMCCCSLKTKTNFVPTNQEKN